jgi:hypothetical protein
MAKNDWSYLYVLDYSDCTICEIELDEEDSKLTTFDILHRRGMDADECAHMYTNNRIEEITPITIEL